MYAITFSQAEVEQYTRRVSKSLALLRGAQEKGDAVLVRLHAKHIAGLVQAMYRDGGDERDVYQVLIAVGLMVAPTA